MLLLRSIITGLHQKLKQRFQAIYGSIYNYGPLETMFKVDVG